VGQALARALAAGLLLCAACGDLPAHTLRVAPEPPPDVDPELGFGGRVRVEGRTDASRAEFHAELFHGERLELRRSLGVLALELPAVITLTAELAAEPPHVTIELAPDGGAPRSLAAELPAEFPARGGLASPALLLEERTASDAECVPLFGVRRGGRVTLTGPEGPFAADEIVVRFVLELHGGG